jgi:soluble lytic murein transglycosylase-like protein
LKYRNEVIAAATKYGVPPLLALAVMRQESKGRQSAVSAKGATGLMQLMPATAKELGVDPNDPLQNIDGGVRYLAKQLKTFGATDLALAAYNAGPGRVRQFKGIPPYQETQNYVKRIMAEVQAQQPAAPARGLLDIPRRSAIEPEPKMMASLLDYRPEPALDIDQAVRDMLPLTAEL